MIREIKHLLKAFVFSAQGFVAAFRSEIAFRWEIAILVIGAIAACLLRVGATARAMMISSLVLILFAEAVNTAIEAIIDRIGPEIHPLSKKAKDLGSLLTLLALINAAAIWIIILCR